MYSPRPPRQDDDRLEPAGSAEKYVSLILFHFGGSDSFIHLSFSIASCITTDSVDGAGVAYGGCITYLVNEYAMPPSF